MLNLHFISTTMLLQIPVALIAGFLGAIAGGGGLITLPAILAMGLPPQTALGTNKMLAAFTTLPSATVFVKKGIFEPKYWLPAMFGGGAGTIAGVISVQILSENFLNKLLPIIIISAAIHTVFFDNAKTSTNKLTTKVNFKPPLFSSSILSAILGFYSGFAGAGLGVFWVSSLVALYKLDIIEASGVARAMCFISNIIAFLFFTLFGHVNYLVGTFMGIFMACGSFIGAHFAIKLGSKFIKFIMFLISAILTYHLIVTTW